MADNYSLSTYVGLPGATMVYTVDASAYTGTTIVNSVGLASAIGSSVGGPIKTYTAPPPRHPKMVGESRPYVALLEEDMKEAEGLGLHNEASRIRAQLIQADVEELTRGAGYPEVTEKDLEAMFEFPRLRRAIKWYNFKSRINPNRDVNDLLRLRIVYDSAGSSRVPLIKGAKLRMAEAKATGIFEYFQVAYPNVVTERQLAKERDPALIGWANGRMYLICSWDIPKDIARVETDMEALRKKKITE